MIFGVGNLYKKTKQSVRLQPSTK